MHFPAQASSQLLMTVRLPDICASVVSSAGRSLSVTFMSCVHVCLSSLSNASPALRNYHVQASCCCDEYQLKYVSHSIWTTSISSSSYGGSIVCCPHSNFCFLVLYSIYYIVFIWYCLFIVFAVVCFLYFVYCCSCIISYFHFFHSNLLVIQVFHLG